MVHEKRTNAANLDYLVENSCFPPILLLRVKSIKPFAGGEADGVDEGVSKVLSARAELQGEDELGLGIEGH